MPVVTDGQFKPIAFFDVDKTLCKCYSGYFTTRELIFRGIIKKRRLLKALLYKIIGPLFKQVNIRKMYEIALADMAGTHIKDIMQIGLEVFEKEVRPQLYVEAIEEIHHRRNEGFEIVLISSGPYMLVKNLEAFLKAENSFSIGPEIRDGILQKNIQEPLCYKEGKVRVAKEYASAKQVSLTDCLFYTDSISDLPLLKLVGGPKAVNPDKHLYKEARVRGWPILSFEKLLGPNS